MTQQLLEELEKLAPDVPQPQREAAAAQIQKVMDAAGLTKFPEVQERLKVEIPKALDVEIEDRPLRKSTKNLAKGFVNSAKKTGGLDAILRERRDKAERLAAAGWPSFPNGLTPAHTTKHVRAAGATASETPEGEPFTVGGRLKSIRGKKLMTFADLWDRDGKIQIQIARETVGDEVYEKVQLLDIGDIVLVTGPRFRTRAGELTIQVQEIRLATKSLHPLPSVRFGFEDQEQRYRERYADLLINDDTRDVFLKRTRLIKFIRRFLDDREFMEVETPMLHDLVAGAAAKPFITHHNALDMDLYCRIAPELHLKRLLVGGFDRVYEIGRNFRNEGLSTRHNPEFTMLELYYAWATYDVLMDLTEEMLRGAALEVAGATSVPYGDHQLDFGAKFRRISVREGLKEKLSGTDISDPDALHAAATDRGLDLERSAVGKMQMDLFELLWEEELVQPTFVTDFPIEVSPLARKKDSDPTLTDRFELYVAGREIANAFSELNDPDDQRARFQAQVEAKKHGDEEAMDYDEDYCHALELGMPPAAGEGVGIDRLCMLLTNQHSIRDVILFPQMRKA